MQLVSAALQLMGNMHGKYMSWLRWAKQRSCCEGGEGEEEELLLRRSSLARRFSRKISRNWWR